MGGGDVGEAGAHQFAIDDFVGAGAARDDAGGGVAQFVETAPLGDAVLYGGKEVAAFQRGLFQGIDEKAVGVGDGVGINFVAMQLGGAGADDGGAGGEPLSPDYRGFGRGDADDDIAVGDGVAVGCGGDDRDAELGRHSFRKGAARLGPAAVGVDFRYRADGAGGAQLVGGLIAGSDDAQSLDLGVRQVVDGDAGGGASAELAEAVGLAAEEHPSGAGVVEADLEGVAAGGVGEGFDAKESIVEEGAAHYGQVSAGAGDAAAGEVDGGAAPVVRQHCGDGGEQVGHANAGVDFGVGEEARHNAGCGGMAGMGVSGGRSRGG